MTCCDTMSDYLLVKYRCKPGMCPCPKIIEQFYGPCTGHDIVSIGAVHITDLVFLDDALIFAETTEILSEARESQSQQAKPLGLRVSWIGTNGHAFSVIVDATNASIPVSYENGEVRQTFTHICSVIYSPTGCEPEIHLDWDESGLR